MSILKNLKDLSAKAFIKVVKNSGRVFINDTTLRDGEQAPGASLDRGQKLEIAKALENLGVDSIEAGFPISSKEDFAAVENIAKNVRQPLITSLCRARREDIDAAREALKHARRWGLSLFIGTSPQHRKYKFGLSRGDIVSLAVESVRYAKKFTDKVAFGFEDASRTEPEFLYEICNAVIDAGAIAVTMPDTVGLFIPSEVEKFFDGIKRNIKKIDAVLLGVHFHNDLGLAVANTLTAIKCGVNTVQCTINGIGERAGNAALEEIAMALKMKKDYYKVATNIDTTKLRGVSKLVSELTGLSVSWNKSIVGKNVFATEAGIHQSAILKNPETYEYIKPEYAGLKKTEIILGRHSGKGALFNILKTLGITVDKDLESMVYERFMETALTKKEVTHDDLLEIAKNLNLNSEDRS